METNAQYQFAQEVALMGELASALNDVSADPDGKDLSVDRISTSALQTMADVSTTVLIHWVAIVVIVILATLNLDLATVKTSMNAKVTTDVSRCASIGLVTTRATVSLAID